MESLNNSLFVIMLLMVNFIATMLYLFFLSNEKRKKKFFSMPFFIQKLFVFLFIGPLFISPVLQQVRINLVIFDFGRIILSILFILCGFIIIIFG